MAETSTHLEGLNGPQKEAVLHKEGPLLIIAGAGAGKTRVLTHRILHLIKSGVAPENILAITFTNKAAREMSERVETLLKGEATLHFPLSTFDLPLICTFHSLGVRILRMHGRHIDVKRHFKIFDQDDSRALVKQALKVLDLDPKQFEPKRIAGTISKQKGELVDQKAYAADAHEYYPKVVARVWEEYERALKKENGLDFDDLLLKTVELLRTKKEIHNEYHNRFHYIHIDEYQDTNVAQYELSKLLANARENICCVADIDQCLPKGTQIATPHGQKSIEKLKAGDRVYSAAGHGGYCAQPVEKVHKRTFAGNLIEIHTKKGGCIRLTPGHIMFATLRPTKNIYYTYLMYRRDRGFRIGIVQGVRNFRAGTQEIGLRTRINQEHADRVWILKVSKTRAQAQYWEQYFAFTYGIPTTVFHSNGRKMDMREDEITHLFDVVPTQERAERLFEETGLSFNCPHYAPQGTTRTNTERERIKIRITLCDDKRKSGVNPWGLSRVSINTTNKKLKQKFINEGYSIRKGKRNDWRLDAMRLDYGEIEKIARHIETFDPAISITRSGAITRAGRMLFQPAANILPTMRIAYWNKNALVEDTVTDVKTQSYTGPVYDLDIAHTHNYIAEHIPVHNSIYTWRGADFRNVMNLETDFKNIKTVLLEENYRSTQTILSAANEVIKKNKMRKEKNLFTQKEEGEAIGLYGGFDEHDEAEFVAAKAQEFLQGGAEPKDIAVLYRANFQSRVLEDAFLRHDIPYQVLGVKFFARKEVKDVLAFLSAALNPDSATDIKRIINVPPRGIGKATIVRIFSGQRARLTAKMKERVDAFFASLGKVKEAALTKKPFETIQFIIKESGMHAAYKKGDEEDIERLENVYELAELAKRYDHLPPEEGVAKLLEDAALAGDQDSLVHTTDKKQINAVRLMTVHAAKGLEFPYVFVTGLEQDLFPHAGGGFAGGRAAEERAEEERRLFYVALTRAEKKAILTYASARTVFGMKQINLPSEFITDIPEESLAEEEMPENIIV